MAKPKVKAWEPADEPDMSPELANQIVWTVRDGTFDPEQVKRLAAYFVECGASGSFPDRSLLRWMCDALAGYLRQDKPTKGELERRLGLIRKASRPTSKTNDEHQIALAVLRDLLHGKSRTLEIHDSAKVWHASLSTIEKCWDRHKGIALNLESAGRALASADKRARWTSAEIRQLRKLYGKGILPDPET